MKRIYIHVAVCSEHGEIKLHRFKTATEAREFVAGVKAMGGRVLVGWCEK